MCAAEKKPFFYPLRPSLRIAAGVVGLLGLVGTSMTSYREMNFEVGRFWPVLFFILVSFPQPERRSDGVSSRTVALVAILLLSLLSGVLWFVYSGQIE